MTYMPESFISGQALSPDRLSRCESCTLNVQVAQHCSTEVDDDYSSNGTQCGHDLHKTQMVF
jgi:hypothetical protein